MKNYEIDYEYPPKPLMVKQSHYIPFEAHVQELLRSTFENKMDEESFYPDSTDDEMLTISSNKSTTFNLRTELDQLVLSPKDERVEDAVWYSVKPEKLMSSSYTDNLITAIGQSIRNETPLWQSDTASHSNAHNHSVLKPTNRNKPIKVRIDGSKRLFSSVKVKNSSELPKSKDENLKSTRIARDPMQYSCSQSYDAY